MVLCVLAGPLNAEIPKSIPHQGRIAVSGVNFDGTGQFKFLLFADPDADHASGNETALWSNAATSPAGMAEPASAVSMPVSKGLYGTWLGDAAIANMAALPASIEPPAASRLYLRIWFSSGIPGFQALAPDQAIAAVPFALHAAGVAAGGVTAESLADGAITSTKLADGAVSQTKLGEGAVTASALAGGAVTNEKLAVGAVTDIGAPGQPGSISRDITISPRDFHEFPQMQNPISVAAASNFVYVGDNDFTILDVSNPDNIVERDSFPLGFNGPDACVVSGGLAYMVRTYPDPLLILPPAYLFTILDVSDPDIIVKRGEVLINDDPFFGIGVDLAMAGGFAYVLIRTQNAASLQIFDVSDPDNIVARDSDQTGLSNPTGIAVADGFAYVIDATTDRLQVFDISNPNNIVARDFDQTGLSTPAGIAVADGFAFVVDATTDRLQAFDISDPDNVVARDFDQTGLSNPSGIAVAEGFAYVVDKGTDRLQVFDVRNPDNIVAGNSDGTGLGGVGIAGPEGIAVLGSHAYVVDNGTDRLQVFTLQPSLAVNGELRVAGAFRATGQSTFDAVAANTASISGALSTGPLTATSGTFSGEVSSATATANTFNLSTPKSYTLSIPGTAMLPQNQSENLFRSTLGYIQQAAGTDLAFGGVAAVNLPEGAVITGIDTLYYDNAVAADFSDLTVRVRRVQTTASPVVEQNILSTNIGASSSSSTAMIVSTNNTPDASRVVVNNALFTYFVSITYTVSAADSNLRFYGFRIRYNVSSLTP